MPPDVPILLPVGRLDPDKNVERVLQAAAQVLSWNHAHLLIVGDGLRKPVLMKLCESLGISDRVHFTGSISTKMRADGPPPVAHPVWLGRNEVLRSTFTGLLYPMVEPGQTVAEGTLIARVTYFHGKVLEEIRSPFAGEILYVVATPPITKGEPVGAIGQRAAAPDVR